MSENRLRFVSGMLTAFVFFVVCESVFRPGGLLVHFWVLFVSSIMAVAGITQIVGCGKKEELELRQLFREPGILVQCGYIMLLTLGASVFCTLVTFGLLWVGLVMGK